MAQNGKRIKKLQESVDVEKIYTLDEALTLVKKNATAKFDESVDVAVQLGVDAKNSSQNVRGMVSLPNGTGKDIRVAVIAKGDAADKAKAAGADIVGEDELIEDIKQGKLDFDRCIATPDLMAKVGAVAKVLGPKGLMPNPKLGTVTPDVEKAVKDAKSGQVEFKIEKAGIVHASVGKVSFDESALKANIHAFIEALNNAKPSGTKGTYLKDINLSSTMGLGLKIEVATAATS